jgi:hypothetical protein
MKSKLRKNAAKKKSLTAQDAAPADDTNITSAQSTMTSLPPTQTVNPRQHSSAQNNLSTETFLDAGMFGENEPDFLAPQPPPRQRQAHYQQSFMV